MSVTLDRLWDTVRGMKDPVLKQDLVSLGTVQDLCFENGIATVRLAAPGSDQFHPTAIGQQICSDAPDARCLDVDARSETKLTGTIEQVRQFLLEHAP